MYSQYWYWIGTLENVLIECKILIGNPFDVFSTSDAKRWLAWEWVNCIEGEGVVLWNHWSVYDYDFRPMHYTVSSIRYQRTCIHRIKILQSSYHKCWWGGGKRVMFIKLSTNLHPQIMWNNWSIYDCKKVFLSRTLNVKKISIRLRN